MPLRLIIENIPADELAPMPTHPSCEFIEAAIHAAKHSNSETRNTILADVCEILNCHPTDLDFLFVTQPVVIQPRVFLGLELPDYRISHSNIYKEAAE